MIILLLSITTVACIGQNSYTTKDIFSAEKLVYFGIDFSKVKLQGPSGFSRPEEIVSTIFPGINEVVVMESTKYNIQEAFRVKSVQYDFNCTSERNKNVDPDTLVGYEHFTFDINTLQSMINEYTTNVSEGIGLVFVAECLSKLDTKGYYHIVLFDVATKKILLSQKAAGQAGGIGIRNFWARSVFEVIDRVNARSYRTWKSDAYRS